MEMLDDVAAVLSECRTASLATVGADGWPHAVNVQYVSQGLEVFWLSDPASLHSRHVQERATAAVTVYHGDDTDPTSLRGVQMHGRVAVVSDADGRARAWARYLAKFDFLDRDERMRERAVRMTIYRFTPTWVRLIDNRRGFGYKCEIKV